MSRLGRVFLGIRRYMGPFRRGPIGAVRGYVRFFRDRRRFIALGGDAPLTLAFPQLFEALNEHELDTHYFFQAGWAARKIASIRPPMHFDVASDNRFVATLSGFIPTTWIDIRALPIQLAGLETLRGSLLRLPLEDASVESLSCLSVLEHVGLGRYGDDLDPQGMVRGARELSRVLALEGDLYVSVPVGSGTHTQFNAHRVSTPSQMLRMFEDLELVSFGAVEGYSYLENLSTDQWKPRMETNGLFHFRRSGSGLSV